MAVHKSKGVLRLLTAQGNEEGILRTGFLAESKDAAFQHYQGKDQRVRSIKNSSLWVQGILLRTLLPSKGPLQILMFPHIYQTTSGRDILPERGGVLKSGCLASNIATAT